MDFLPDLLQFPVHGPHFFAGLFLLFAKPLHRPAKFLVGHFSLSIVTFNLIRSEVEGVNFVFELGFSRALFGQCFCKWRTKFFLTLFAFVKTVFQRKGGTLIGLGLPLPPRPPTTSATGSLGWKVFIGSLSFKFVLLWFQIRAIIPPLLYGCSILGLQKEKRIKRKNFS